METAKIISSNSQQFCIVAKKWASDIAFFKTETAFFNTLIIEHFMHMPRCVYFETLMRVMNDLSNLDIDLNKVTKMLTLEVLEAEVMEKYAPGGNTQNLAVMQVKLEYHIMQITLRFRDIKKQLFTLIEDVIKGGGLLAAS